MRGLIVIVIVIVIATGCVKGNPTDFELGPGGTLPIPGCGYDLTTRDGAEPPGPGLP